MPFRVRILISIPPKYAVAKVIGRMKGKSSISIAQNVERKVRNFTDTNSGPEDMSYQRLGREEEEIRTYIRLKIGERTFPHHFNELGRKCFVGTLGAEFVFLAQRVSRNPEFGAERTVDSSG